MLRITGGEFRGRVIQGPPGEGTRPTQVRIRQALFNSMQAQVVDAKVVDLFAGSGALGFEALSRGAVHAVFVERARPLIQVIRKNAQALGVMDRVTILEDSVAHVTAKLESLGPFQLVLADPPYEEGWEMRILNELSWSTLLAPDGCLCLEWGLKKSIIDELPDKVQGLEKIREKNYGDSVLTTYSRV